MLVGGFSGVKTIRLVRPVKGRKITDVLSAVDRNIAVIAKQIKQVEPFKKSLLQKMFV